MHTNSELLALLQPAHVVEALNKLDAGEKTEFGESTKFDLVYLGQRYPPKRVAGLALQVMTGSPFGPKSFKGGEESSCFRALRRCGFTVSVKTHPMERTLAEDLSEILSLQKRYQSTNTPEMQRRGVLIRNVIPDQIRMHLHRLEPTFTKAGYALDIEGSDGLGRKAESAWVRIYDPMMSPSATTGWYLVLHFSREGQAFFTTVGCGATRFRDGSLYPIPDEELLGQVKWAQSIASDLGFPVAEFSDPIELRGNKLSMQFEKATALSKKHEITTFNEGAFWNDLETLCSLLVRLYDRERLGKAPLSEPPEMVSGQAEIEQAVSKRKARGSGQGRGLTKEEKDAVEGRAMVVAKQAILEAGFTDIDDVHKKESFDFEAVKAGVSWMIEVKGTTSPCADQFLITAAELALHKVSLGHTALVLVFDIELDRSAGNVKATGGKVELCAPWTMEGWEFQPTAYRAKRMSPLLEGQ